MKHPIYKIKNLRVKYDSAPILDVKKFEVHRGACYVIYGNIGSGKTTLLNFIAKDKKPDNETVFYEKNDINKISRSKYKRDICFVPQNISTPWFSVKVSDYIFNKVKGYGHIDNPKENIKRISSRMNLNHLMNMDYRTLSLGEKRWVDLASAIACDTKVLIIDGFGQYMGSEKMSVLSKVLYRKVNYDGVTVIVTTHNKESLSKLASVYIHIESGRIIGVRSQHRRPQYSDNRRKRRPRKNSPK